MDTKAILKFNKIDDNAIVNTPEGSTLYQGHITMKWPASKLRKKRWYDYYNHILSEKDYSVSQINDCMNAMISTVEEYEHKSDY